MFKSLFIFEDSTGLAMAIPGCQNNIFFYNFLFV